MIALGSKRVLVIGAPDGPLGALADALRPTVGELEVSRNVGVVDRETWDLIVLDPSRGEAAYYREVWPWTLVEAPDEFVPSIALVDPSDPIWVQADVYVARARPVDELVAACHRVLRETARDVVRHMEPRVPPELDPLFTFSAQELRKLTTLGASTLGLLQSANDDDAPTLPPDYPHRDSGARIEREECARALGRILERIEHLARSQINHARRSRGPIVSVDLRDTLTFVLSRLGEDDATISIAERCPRVRGNAGLFAIVLASVLAGHGRTPPGLGRSTTEPDARALEDRERPPLHVAVIRSFTEGSVTLQLTIPKSDDDAEPALTDDDDSPIPIVSAWSWELLLHGLGARPLPQEWRDDEDALPEGPARFAVALETVRE
ncbi:hypothetical protein L6R52_38640 [Myxococcota bacterium]|nr:hypothetical protein [Myxococcota bacterium]